MPRRIAEQPPVPLQPYSAALLNQQPPQQHDDDDDNMAVDDVKPAAVPSQAANTQKQAKQTGGEIGAAVSSEAEVVQPHASAEAAAAMDVDVPAADSASSSLTSTATRSLGKPASALIDELFASSDTEEDEDNMDASDSASSSPSSLATMIKICTQNDDRMEVLDSEEEGEEDEEEDDEYETCSSSDDDDSDDDDDNDDEENGGRRCKRARLSSKSTMRKGRRKGLPSQAEMKEAVEQDPDYNALATLVQFLQGADATSAEVMAEHLQPREMVRPFQEVQVAAIHAKAASMPPKVVKLKEEQPKPYKKVRRMVFHASMKGEVDIFKDDSNDHQCQCLSMEEAAASPPASREDRGVCCDEMCLNRSLNVECSEETCRFAATGECKNQRIGRRLQAPSRVFRTEGRGWGVAAVEDVEVGTFVSEYVGEVIDDEEVARRLWLAKEEEGEGADFYMVEAVGATVDARYFGNESRFLNHSCDPNCRLEKWNVGGSYRLGIFAIKPIPAGTEYCWDYQFSNFEGSKPKACRCGAATCRKVLAGKAYRDEAAEQAQMQAPVSVRVEKLQRAVQEAEAFRAMLREKPLHDLDPLVLFFNGRTSPGEMEQAQQARLWLTKDGPGVAAREKRRMERVQRKAAAAAAATAAAAAGPAQSGTAPASIPTTATATKSTATTTTSSSSTTSQLLLNNALQARLDAMLAIAAKEAETEEKQRAEAAAAAAAAATSKKGGKRKGASSKDAGGLQQQEEEERQLFQRRVQAKVLGELTELAVQRGTKTLVCSTGRRRYSPRRLGLLSLREKRWTEATFLPFAEKLVGEARMQGWHESRWQAVSDMIVFMKQSESKGLWGDMSEDICYSCGCSGDLVCCDACTSAYHVSCAGLYEVPDESQWFCTRCTRKAGGGSRRQR